MAGAGLGLAIAKGLVETWINRRAPSPLHRVQGCREPPRLLEQFEGDDGYSLAWARLW